MKITVDGQDVEVVAEFPVLHAGWECDSKGWIVAVPCAAESEDGTLRLVMSSHEDKYFADPMELEQKITEYGEAVSQTRRALRILAGQIPSRIVR